MQKKIIKDQLDGGSYLEVTKIISNSHRNFSITSEIPHPEHSEGSSNVGTEPLSGDPSLLLG